MADATPIHGMKPLGEAVAKTMANLEAMLSPEVRGEFSAAALQRTDTTYDQLSGAIKAAELKADALSPEIKRAYRRIANPSRTPLDLKLAREEIARAQRFTNQLAEMLAVIANELAERTA